MHASKLEQGGDAVEEAHQEEPVERGRVSHLRQVRTGVQAYGGQGQDGSDAQADSVRRCLTGKFIIIVRGIAGRCMSCIGHTPTRGWWRKIGAGFYLISP